MIKAELLEILRCPKTHQKLVLANPELIEELNILITQGQLRNCGGKVIEAPLQAGLLCEDRMFLYPIRGNLPIMLVDEAIRLPGG